MSLATKHGTPPFPTSTGSIQPSTQETIDEAIQVLQSHKDAWVAVPIRERIAILNQLIKDVATLAPRWVAACNEAKGIANDTQFAGEEWFAGPIPVLKTLRQLRQSLTAIATYGQPRIPGPITTRPDGQVVAQVFPLTTYDRMSFTGITGEIWMEPGVTTQTLSQTQALAYREKQHAGKVNLVLGAGNVSCIGPLDILYKMFVEDQVVLLKMNPVNAYVGPFIAESLQALIQRNFLRIVYGGTTEGAYLCNHPGIDEIHITGSDKTFEAIVFGTGEQGATRKAQRKPQLEKRVTGELGNVSPVILVPGPWTPDEIAYHAEHLVTTLIVNAGFNCNATRVILQHASWDQREPFLQAMRKILTQLPLRDAYYPGAHERHQHFLASHPKAEQFGHPQEKQLPWTLITGLDPTRADDPCFTTEAFCSLFSETALVAENVVEYIEQAVSFCNERLWGTLNATILVHPQSLKVPEVAAAIERAVANLRYGTIGVNCWAGSGFLLGTTTWGAFPGHTIYDVQSGIGVVRNTLMFSRPQKSVLRGTFRNVPTPAWFATHGKIATRVVPKLADFEAAPSFWKVLALIWTAMKG